VAYAVSAFHERTDHMSPVAMLLAAVLHAATAAALFWVSPLNRHDLEEDPIEVTIEQPKPPDPPKPSPLSRRRRPRRSRSLRRDPASRSASRRPRPR